MEEIKIDLSFTEHYICTLVVSLNSKSSRAKRPGPWTILNTSIWNLIIHLTHRSGPYVIEYDSDWFSSLQQTHALTSHATSMALGLFESLVGQLIKSLDLCKQLNIVSSPRCNPLTYLMMNRSP